VICNRQATEKDAESQKIDKDGQALGARVYGDCDVFMRYVMENLLEKDKLNSFLSDILVRRKEYNTKRQQRKI